MSDVEEERLLRREDGATREFARLAQVGIDECPRNPERHGGIAQS
jgi:hypothetical protein